MRPRSVARQGSQKPMTLPKGHQRDSNSHTENNIATLPRTQGQVNHHQRRDSADVRQTTEATAKAVKKIPATAYLIPPSHLTLQREALLIDFEKL